MVAKISALPHRRMGDLHGARDHFYFMMFISDESYVLADNRHDTGMSADKFVLRIIPQYRKTISVETMQTS